MKYRNTFGNKVFTVFNYTFLGFFAVLCVLPLINVLAMSFSTSSAVAAGMVEFWPVDFTTKAYQFVTKDDKFLKAAFVSVKRLVLGVSVNMLLTILSAYPLSKQRRVFRFRNFYTWFFFITILFSGGLIPLYITVTRTGLIDTIWALIIPTAVPVFNVILLLNFFRQLPKEIEEAAYIDGAGHWLTLLRIYLPLSVPALATLILFSTVGHWNEWFMGLIYMNSPQNYPLSTYLQTVVVNVDIALRASTDLDLLQDVSDRTSKAAQIFLGMLPVLAVYPFLQKYFMKGILLGSVKG